MSGNDPSQAPDRRRATDHRSHVRYGDFLSAVRLKQRAVSYNVVAAHDRAHPRAAARLRLKDLHRLLTPYVSVRLVEQLRAVLPLAIFLAVFLVAALRADIREAESITLGILAVVLGLMFFMEGVRYGLMPFSEGIGYALPMKARRTTVLAVGFVIGVAATFAEPAIGALRAAGASVDRVAAPALHLLLNQHSGHLVAAVGVGVGVAVTVALLRFFNEWSLKKTLLWSLAPCLAITLFAGQDPRLAPVLGLAWDCGAITTGPVTVPLVLALGIGVSAATGRADNPLAGFGIVTLASLFPSVAVLLVAIGVVWEAPAAQTLAPAAAQAVADWHDGTPFLETKAALRAIVPLVLLLAFAQVFIVGQKTRNQSLILYGICVAIAGMTLFNVGLTLGLVPLGDQAGEMVPSAFAAPAGSTGGPLYSYPFGITLTLLFAAAIGYGATVAEPALNAMGRTVEDLTDGAFPRRLLVQSVAAGVAGGTALGVVKIIFGLPMLPLLLGGYGIAIALTVLSGEEYVNLAWDSAGVTTGPVTVPLILALGLGLGQAVGAVEGFGILAMASLGPILSVLSVGLWIRMKSAERRRERGTA